MSGASSTLFSCGAGQTVVAEEEGSSNDERSSSTPASRAPARLYSANHRTVQRRARRAGRERARVHRRARSSGRDPQDEVREDETTGGGITVVDVDDFHDENNGLEILDRVHDQVGGFRATLFTVVALTGSGFLEREWRPRRDWLELVPHGWHHATPRECENWTLPKCRWYLDLIENSWLDPYYERGFKAPGWQISDAMYEALLERGWWVADQAYNDERRPPELRAYILDRPGRVHFHVQDVCGNGLAESIETLLSLRGPFRFVSEVV